ncbi:MAG: nucleotidyltransferase family protein, partial [Planctomycetes bacterium]|nr:nucleotidyltransferase family protein [Planctomycetota bacterium]
MMGTPRRPITPSPHHPITPPPHYSTTPSLQPRIPMKAIILAAGKGTRMKGLCDAQPKPMLPLLNRPMLDHILGGVREAGITEVLLVVGTHSEAIERHFGDGAALGLSIRYAHQRVPTGTGSAALLGKDFTADSPFLLAFGDIIISRREYARLARYYVERGCDTVLTTRWVPDPFRGAAVYVEGDKVVQIIEKPTPGTSTTHFDNA